MAYAQGAVRARVDVVLRLNTLRFCEAPEQGWRRQVMPAGEVELDARVESVLTDRNIEEVFSNGTAIAPDGPNCTSS